jgi:hypothetical protein
LVIKTLDPDPKSLEMLDPDSMNPDPQHWEEANKIAFKGAGTIQRMLTDREESTGEKSQMTDSKSSIYYSPL